ncbi:mechanosensitive ion channel protein MscS [Oleispira antarctica]|uniref:Mechanosensitive ion channel protein MscS n=1 Tax=Oleispira antarctica TaxID=188908 RepID=A0A1Y5I0S7_OLEAN|nr:mechanosensitive ion channel protein MscS [Oleispira antarctica]
MDWWKDLLQQNYDWLWEAGLALLITLAVALAWRSFRKRLESVIKNSKNRWDDIALKAFGIPINWLIIIIGGSWFADISARHFSTEIIDSIPVARQLACLVVIAWGVWRLISGIEIKQLDKGNDPTTVQLVGKVTKLTLTVLIVLPIFQILGISISGMLAFGGMGGLIVGMAAKDLLANFFGSIMIYLDRPFKVGDWVRSPDRNIEGTVEKIGFRLTVIRTFDKRPLYVPNSVFTNISVENPSRMKNRRINETIGVRYEDAKKIPAILDDVRSMLEQHNDIDANQTLIVNLNSFAASSLDFFIYTFTKTTDWVQYHHIKQDVMLQILDIIHKHEADCAFPTQTVHIDSIPEAMAKS